MLTFAAGIVIVRGLPVDQYAFYTLAAAMLGVATTLSDSGMSNAVMARGGAVWQSRDRLGAVVAAGLAIRKKIALAAAAIIVPVLIVLMIRKHGAPWDAFLLCAALLPVFLATNTSPLLEIPLRLHQRLKSLQLLQTLTYVARLACVLLAVLLWPVAWLVVGSALLPQMLLNAKLRTGIAPLADLNAPLDESVRSRILSQIWRATPGNIYFVCAGQLPVFLITIFGTTEAMAHFGALGRLAVMMTFLFSVFQLVAVPRFARIPEADRRKVLERYGLMLGAMAAAAGLIVIVAWVVPEALLFILGERYSSLTGEVTLAMAAGAMTVIANTAGNLAGVRGIVPSPFIFVSAGVAVQAILVCTLPLSEVSSMFWLSLATSTVQLIACVSVFGWRLLRST